MDNSWRFGESILVSAYRGGVERNQAKVESPSEIGDRENTLGQHVRSERSFEWTPHRASLSIAS